MKYVLMMDHQNARNKPNDGAYLQSLFMIDVNIP